MLIFTNYNHLYINMVQNLPRPHILMSHVFQNWFLGKMTDFVKMLLFLETGKVETSKSDEISYFKQSDCSNFQMFLRQRI